MLKIDERLRNGISIASKYVKYSTKRKNNNCTVLKPSRHHLTKWSKLTSLIMGQIDLIHILKRAHA